MKKIPVMLLSSCLAFMSCGDSTKNTTDSTPSKTTSQPESIQEPNEVKVIDIKVVKYEQLLQDIKNNKNEFQIVNFWATWCVPCVKEMPYFFNEINSGKWKGIEWVFVSLDEARLVENKVKPFILDKKYDNATHYLLDDNGRQQEWIDIFSKEWSGSIPATAFYHKGQLVDFHEGIFTEAELTEFLNQNMNK